MDLDLCLFFFIIFFLFSSESSHERYFFDEMGLELNLKYKLVDIYILKTDTNENYNRPNKSHENIFNCIFL